MVEVIILMLQKQLEEIFNDILMIFKEKTKKVEFLEVFELNLKMK
jgi:hypothetical protein